NVDNARCEKFVERVDIRCKTGDRPPDRILVIERDFLPLKLFVDLGAQVVHNLLPDRIQQDLLNVPENKSEQEHGKEEQRKKPYAVGNFRRDEIIDRDFCKIWLCAEQDVAQERKDECRNDQKFVWFQIPKQSSGEPQVVCLSYRLFFVVFFYCVRHVY